MKIKTVYALMLICFISSSPSFCKDNEIGNFINKRIERVELYYLPLSVLTSTPYNSEYLRKNSVIHVEIYNQLGAIESFLEEIKDFTFERPKIFPDDEKQINYRILLRIVDEEEGACEIGFGRDTRYVIINREYYFLRIELLRLIGQLLPNNEVDRFFMDIDERIQNAPKGNCIDSSQSRMLEIPIP